MKAIRTIASLVAVAGGFVAAAILLPHSPAQLRDTLDGYGPAAPFVALAAWALLTTALFPGTLLAAACGLAFGAVQGCAVACIGAVLGGLTAFGLARTSARTAVERVVRRRDSLRRAESALASDGFRAVLAARLMPGLPASWLHYLAGMSPVRVRSFATAIAVGAILRTIPYALLGESLGSRSGLTAVFALVSVLGGGLGAAALGRRLRAAERSAATPASP